MDGWVKIHRKIKDNWIWDNPDYLKAWLDLIFRANFEEKKILFDGEIKEIQCGQFITSIRKLAEAWNWSNGRVLKFLRLLEDDGMIKRDSNSKRTLLTIENYEFYQVSQNTDDNTGKNTNKPQRRKKEVKKNTPSEKDSAAQKKIDDTLEHNFNIIYKEYKKKRGRADAFKLYSEWVTTGRVINKKRIKLDDMKIFCAIKKYNAELESRNIPMKYYKDFSTFMKTAILDYVDWGENE